MAPQEEYMTYKDVKMAMDEVEQELGFATAKFGPFNSAHEGYAIIAEELDELWEEVRAKQGARDIEAMRKEACQVAAMAIRFMVDICTPKKGQK